MNRAHMNNLTDSFADILAMLLTPELPQRSTRAEELASQIHVQNGIPVLKRHLNGRGIFLES